MATISGGGATTTVPLSPDQIAAAQAAINAILAQQQVASQATLQTAIASYGNQSVQVLTSIPRGGASGVVTIYEINNPVENASYTLVKGTQGAILEGTSDSQLVGRAGVHELLVGNSGNDTINGAGGNGTIIGGNGNNTVTTGAGATGYTITVGNGNDTINLSTGNDTVTTGTGNDSITLGTGNDTINSGGSATVIGSTGNFEFHDNTILGSPGTDSVSNGFGNATLYAGGGNDSFSGGTGSTVFYAGAGNDTFQGGTGGTDNFTFDTNKDSGGNITVAGYVASDTIVSGIGTTNTAGNFVVAATADTFDGTNTNVTLNDGTHITFLGVDVTSKFQPS